MTTLIIILVVIALLLLAGGVFFLRGRQVEPPATPAGLGTKTGQSVPTAPEADKVRVGDAEVDSDLDVEAEVALEPEVELEPEPPSRPSFRERLTKARSTVSGYFGSVLSRSDINADTCLLYTSPSPRDKRQSRMPSSA